MLLILHPYERKKIKAIIINYVLSAEQIKAFAE